jgi:Zn-dependent protease with chaperone function
MQTLFVVALSSLVLTGTVSASSKQNKSPDSTAARLQAVLDQGSSNEIVAEWMERKLNSLIRADLDRKVVELLATDPVAKKVMVQVRGAIGDLVEAYRSNMMANAALAQPGRSGQFQKELKIVQSAAEKLGFKKSARDAAHVFVMGSPTVNAFTYSPLLSEVDVVFYDGLLERMSEGEVLAIAGHELGHIKSGHVLTGVAVQAIFLATGTILIPEEKADAFEAIVQTEGRKLLRSSLGLDHIPDSDAIVDVYFDLASHVADRIVKSIPKAELARIVSRLQSTLLSTSKALEDEQDPKKALEELHQLKKFKEMTKALSRSQEVTADRWAIVAAGPENVIGTMSNLAGGARANPAAILAQAERLLEDATRRGADLRAFAAEGHPDTITRALQFKVYSQTLNYKILTDPFIRSVNLYLQLSRELAQAKAQIDNDMVEMVRAEQINLRRDHLKTFADSMANSITSIVMEEVVGAESDPNAKVENTLKLIEHLDKLTESPYSPSYSSREPGLDGYGAKVSASSQLVANPDLGKPGALFFELVTQLEARADNPLAQTVAGNLRSRVRISSARGGTNAVLAQLEMMKANAGGAGGAKTCQAIFQGRP